METGFRGFPQEGLDFFRRLKKNNKREWFQPRKEEFDELVRAPMLQLVDAVNERLIACAPDYVTDPEKALYRIYRDTRFSKDKTPYKDHIAANFPRRGLGKHCAAGYYFSVNDRQIEVAAGVYMPGRDELEAIRRHVANHHEDFRRLIADRNLRKLLGDLQGEQLSRPPKGFLPDDPAIDLVRYKQYIFYRTDLPVEWATSKKLAAEIAKRFAAAAEFVEFLNVPLIPAPARSTPSPY